jgi:hypothetical protein
MYRKKEDSRVYQIVHGEKGFDGLRVLCYKAHLLRREPELLSRHSAGA